MRISLLISALTQRDSGLGPRRPGPSGKGSASEPRDPETAREFFGLAARFLGRASDQAGADQARLEVGEMLVLRAEAEERATNPAFAQQFWEKAILTFRDVPVAKAKVPELHSEHVLKLDL